MGKPTMSAAPAPAPSPPVPVEPTALGSEIAAAQEQSRRRRSRLTAATTELSPQSALSRAGGNQRGGDNYTKSSLGSAVA